MVTIIYGGGGHIGHVTWHLDLDLDGLNEFLFLPTLKTTYEICLQLAKWLLRCLKLSNYCKTWVKGHRMTLIFSTHKYSCNHSDKFNHQFEAKIFRPFHKILCILFFPYFTLP